MPGDPVEQCLAEIQTYDMDDRRGLTPLPTETVPCATQYGMHRVEG